MTSPTKQAQALEPNYFDWSDWKRGALANEARTMVPPTSSETRSNFVKQDREEVSLLQKDVEHKILRFNKSNSMKKTYSRKPDRFFGGQIIPLPNVDCGRTNTTKF